MVCFGIDGFMLLYRKYFLKFFVLWVGFVIFGSNYFDNKDLFFNICCCLKVLLYLDWLVESSGFFVELDVIRALRMEVGCIG